MLATAEPPEHRARHRFALRLAEDDAIALGHRVGGEDDGDWGLGAGDWGRISMHFANDAVTYAV
jgi:hypothetical protein